jgi:signal transduction histidine kinase
MKPYDQMSKEELLQVLIRKEEQEEGELGATTRLLNLLNAGENSHDLIGALLGFFQDLSGCQAVAVRLREGADCPYFESLGFQSEFLQAENYLCTKDSDGKIVCDEAGNAKLDCMCGNVLCGRFDPELPFFTQNGSFWTNSTAALLADFKDAGGPIPLRNRCNRAGYESMALVPLRNNGATIGLMQLNDRRRDRFSMSVISLVERLADSVAIAVARRRSEEALRESEERYRAMIMAFDGLMYICSPDYHIEFQNDYMTRHIGYDATGDFCYQALHGLDAVCPWCANDRVFAGETVRAVRQSPKNKRWYDGSSSPIKKPNGTISKQGLIIDVTDRKELEEALIRQQNELKLANELLEQRVKERTADLESSIREQESFSYSVSHDLRAPLRHMNCFSGLLMEEYREELPVQAREYLDRIINASSRMGTLIDHLLKLSQVTRSRIKQESIDLSHMAESTLRMFQETEPGRRTEVVIEPGITVLGDRHLLRQLLENLLENAWKYTSKTASACIRFGRAVVSGQEAYFVKDNGAGFDMEYREKLFQAFERLHGSEFMGVGIGLATAQRIIQRHGGRIWAEGAVGQGATFYFTLPVYF